MVCWQQLRAGRGLLNSLNYTDLGMLALVSWQWLLVEPEWLCLAAPILPVPRQRVTHGAWRVAELLGSGSLLLEAPWKRNIRFHQRPGSICSGNPGRDVSPELGAWRKSWDTGKGMLPDSPRPCRTVGKWVLQKCHLWCKSLNTGACGTQKNFIISSCQNVVYLKSIST